MNAKIYSSPQYGDRLFRCLKSFWRIAASLPILLLTVAAQTPSVTPQLVDGASKSSAALPLCSPEQQEFEAENISGPAFDLYMRRIAYRVKANWYSLLPESAYLKVRGKVGVGSTVGKSGNLTHIKLVCTSNDQGLDRAAEIAIQTSDPLAPLPEALVHDLLKAGHSDLKMRVYFYYNPKRAKSTPTPRSFWKR